MSIESTKDVPTFGMRYPRHSTNISARHLRIEGVEIALRDSWRDPPGKRVEDFADILDDIAINEDELLSLIRFEIQLRLRQGEIVSHQEYLDRFPLLASCLSIFDEPKGKIENDHATQIVSESSKQSCPKLNLPIHVQVPGYEILEVLGRGGMGVVYKARQVGLNRIVALKMILAGQHAGKEELERFWREAEAVASLNHPNIVQVHEVNQVDGNPYFSLEYIDGGTLADVLRQGPLDPKEAAKLVEQLAWAMQLAHELQIIHRDLKPANILLAKGHGDLSHTVSINPGVGSKAKGRSKPQLGFSTLVTTGQELTSLRYEPKITDFGVAKRLNDTERLTATGIAAGTPMYMSPEQALADSKQALSPASDIYSLGVILYECLTGRVPFDGVNAVDVMRRVVREAPTSPGKICNGLSKDLETICLKCLEKQPSQRYLSAVQLADDLRLWQEGRPITARPVGRVEHTYRWCRRNPMIAGLLAGIAVVMAVGMVTASIFAIKANRYAEVALIRADEAKQKALMAELNAKLADESKQQAIENSERAKASETKALEKERIAKEAQESEEKEKQKVAEQKNREHQLNLKLKAQMYSLRSNMAHADFKIGQVRSTRNILDEMRPKVNEEDLRQFEWYYLKQLSDSAFNRQVLRGQIYYLHATYDPDLWHIGVSNSIYESSISPKLNMFRPLPGGNSTKMDVHITANRVALAPEDEDAVLVCEYETLKVLSRIPIPDRRKQNKLQSVSALRFSPDGSKLLVGVASSTLNSAPADLILWDVPSGKELHRFTTKDASINDAIFTADGKRIVVIDGGNSWWVRDATTFASITEGKSPYQQCSLAINHDASLLMIGCIEGKIVITESASGRVLRQLFGHRDWVTPIVLAPNQKTLATTAADHSIRLWNIHTGENVRTLEGHSEKTTCLAFSNDSKLLMSGSISGQVNTWEWQRDPEAIKSLDSNGIACANFPMPDRKRWLVTDYWGRFRFLDDEGNPLTSHYLATGKRSMTEQWLMSPDGKWLAASISDQLFDNEGKPSFGPDRGLWLIDLENLPGTAKRIPNLPMDIHRLAFSPNGKILATTHHDGWIRVWDVVKRCEISSFKAANTPDGFVVFTDDGKQLIGTSSEQLTISRWTLDGKLVWSTSLDQYAEQAYPNPIGVFSCVAISPDGQQLVVGTTGRDIWLINAQTGKLRQAEGRGSHGKSAMRLKGHGEVVTTLAFDQSSKRLASGSNDLTVRVWDVNEGQSLLTLRGHSRGVQSVAFSADGSGLASLSHTEIRIWDGKYARQREDIAQVAQAGMMQNVRIQIDAEGRARVTAVFVNESNKKYFGPNWEQIDDRLRGVALIDPPVKNLPLDGTMAEADFRRINHTPHIMFSELLPNEAIPFVIEFNTKKWPPGKYKLTITHSSGSLYSGRMAPAVEFVIPEMK